MARLGAGIREYEQSVYLHKGVRNSKFVCIYVPQSDFMCVYTSRIQRPVPRALAVFCLGQNRSSPLSLIHHRNELTVNMVKAWEKAVQKLRISILRKIK